MAIQAESKYDILLLDTQEFAYLTGMTFRGLSVTKHRGTGGWNVILRAETRDRKPVYAMMTSRPGEGIRETAKALMAAVSGKSGKDFWYPDKFA